MEVKMKRFRDRCLDRLYSKPGAFLPKTGFRVWKATKPGFQIGFGFGKWRPYIQVKQRMKFAISGWHILITAVK